MRPGIPARGFFLAAKVLGVFSGDPTSPEHVPSTRSSLQACAFILWKLASASEWRAYTEHPFTTGMADGALTKSAFRHYLVQDYLFLIEFARAYALALTLWMEGQTHHLRGDLIARSSFTRSRLRSAPPPRHTRSAVGPTALRVASTRRSTSVKRRSLSTRPSATRTTTSGPTWSEGESSTRRSSGWRRPRRLLAMSRGTSPI